MHREIASKALTTQLLELGTDKRAHQTVKSRVYDTLETLTKEFKGDPSLRQMEDTFNLLKRSNPALAPPAVPQKHQMTDLDRQREEEELQMVLALSLQESQGPSASQPQQQSQQQNQTQEPSQPITGKTAATVSRVKAIYDLNSDDPGELSFRKGDVITVLESVYRDWWKGSLRGEVGIFPLNYVTPIPDPTPEELAQETRDEQKVFDEARNIEKLLSLLTNAQSMPSSGNIAENEELQNLYHSTQAIRPKLVKMIEKYAQRRDDLIDLDRKFMNARRTYDTLIDTSLSQMPTSSAQPPYVPNGYPQPNYHQGSFQQPHQPPPQQQPSQAPQSNYSQYSSQSNAAPGYAAYGGPQAGSVPSQVQPPPTAQGFPPSSHPSAPPEASQTPQSFNPDAPRYEPAPVQSPIEHHQTPQYAPPSEHNPWSQQTSSGHATYPPASAPSSAPPPPPSAGSYPPSSPVATYPPSTYPASIAAPVPSFPPAQPQGIPSYPPSQPGYAPPGPHFTG